MCCTNKPTSYIYKLQVGTHVGVSIDVWGLIKHNFIDLLVVRWTSEDYALNLINSLGVTQQIYSILPIHTTQGYPPFQHRKSGQD